MGPPYRTVRARGKYHRQNAHGKLDPKYYGEQTVKAPLGGDRKSAFGALDDGVELRGGCLFDGSGECELGELNCQPGWVRREQLEAQKLAAGRRIDRWVDGVSLHSIQNG